MAYKRPQQRKKEESKRLRVERDQIKFIDLRLIWCSNWAVSGALGTERKNKKVVSGTCRKDMVTSRLSSLRVP